MMKKDKKFTPVQQKVMDRFADGHKLVRIETNLMTGDALYWCKQYNGKWYTYDKALYPQLRQLIWDNVITDEMYIHPSELDLSDCYFRNGTYFIDRGNGERVTITRR